MQPLPPIIVNLPPTSGPPWWVTALIALASAIVGILVTAHIARDREHRRWLWEKRFDAYVDLTTALNEIDSLRLPIKFNGLASLDLQSTDSWHETVRKANDARLSPPSIVEPAIYKRMMELNVQLAKILRASNGSTEDREYLESAAEAAGIVTGDLYRLLDTALWKPPSIGLFQRAILWK